MNFLVKCFLMSILVTTLFINSALAVSNKERKNKIVSFKSQVKELAVGGKTQFSDISLPNLNGKHKLKVSKTDVFDSKIKVFVDNVEQKNVSRKTYLKGRIDGVPNSKVFLSVPEPEETGFWQLFKAKKRKKKLNGLVMYDGKVVALEENDDTGEIDAKEVNIADIKPDEPFTCGTDAMPSEVFEQQLESLSSAPPQGNAPVIMSSGDAANFTIKLAIETDYEFYALFNDSSLATDYIGDLIGYISLVYEEEASTQIQVSYIQLYTSGSNSDPWSGNSTSSQLTQLASYWNTNKTNEDRALVHFLSGRNLGGGIAYTSTLCNDSYGYGVSANISGSFDINAPSVVWDAVVVAHEIGHNFSSTHTHCYANILGNSSHIDHCSSNAGGASGCYGGTATLPGLNSTTNGTSGTGAGTIMSYCHTRSPGMSNISFTFGKNHAYGVAANRVSQQLTNFVTSKSLSDPSCVVASNSIHTVTTSKSGTGAGKIFTLDGNIDCGADCIEIYAAGTNVAISAEPEPGSTFTGWSGACTGTGSCTVSIDANKSLTANFSALTDANFVVTHIPDISVGSIDDETVYAMTMEKKPLGKITLDITASQNPDNIKVYPKRTKYDEKNAYVTQQFSFKGAGNKTMEVSVKRSADVDYAALPLSEFAESNSAVFSPSWTRIDSGQSNSNFGTSIAAGDFNNDGYDDLAVGASKAESDSAYKDEGQVFIYYGSNTGLSSNVSETLQPNKKKSMFGHSTAVADVNNDNYDDLVVGAYLYEDLDKAEKDEGSVFVYYGSASGLSNTADLILQKNLKRGYFGQSVASVGDLNNDGYDDIAVGAPRYSDDPKSQKDEGSVFIYMGSFSGLPSSSNFTLEVNQRKANFGYSISGIGDLNSDGYADIAVSARQYEDQKAQSDEGSVFVYFGSNTGVALTPSLILQSNQKKGLLGESIANIGDVNNDGTDDIAIGAPKFDVSVLKDMGSVLLYSGNVLADGYTQPSWQVNSILKKSNFAVSILGVGDISGDNIDDLLVAANLHSSVEKKEGVVYVYLGNTNGPDDLPAQIIQLNEKGALFGTSMTTGDFNNNGQTSIVISAPVATNAVKKEGAVFISD